MRRWLISITGLTALLIGPMLSQGAPIAEANHSWGGYHWARTSNPFTLKLGDNLSSVWDPYLVTTSSDWSLSTVLDTTIVQGAGLKRCGAVSGRVEVCNGTYGNNGWLGIASIWASGSHITQGTVKLNDSYFNTSTYNKPEWRNLVSCQEVGHTFGLGHQDENFSNPNLYTCMDYTSNPIDNQHPNQHDYDQLAAIYSHTDGSTTISSFSPTLSGASRSNADEPGDSPSQWGRAIHLDAHGRADVYELDLGAGQKKITHVFWIRPGRTDP